MFVIEGKNEELTLWELFDWSALRINFGKWSQKSNSKWRYRRVYYKTAKRLIRLPLVTKEKYSIKVGYDNTVSFPIKYEEIVKEIKTDKE